MDYAALLGGIDYAGTAPTGEAAAVVQDSRRVSAGCVFVCIEGRGSDGHAFARAALDAGAGMVVTRRPLGLENEVTVADTRAAYARLCANFFGNPARRLTLAAVTGTNGKTTVSTVLKRILSGLGVRCGLIGTNLCEAGDAVIPAKFTTPEPWELNAVLAQMVRAGCTHAVMEASSQALAQGRLHGLRFALGVFTNLSQDHLDYHGDMRGYYEAKKLLFAQCGAMLANMDDEAGRALLGEAGCAVKRSFSLKSDAADFVAKECDVRADSVRFAFLGEGFLHPVSFPMPGIFSVANALAAAAAAVMLGQNPAAAAGALSAVRGVAGRAEVLYRGEFTVVCDFAHTADALENLLGALREHVKGRLVVLFGCAGVRDADKRHAMGEAVARFADAVYLTADNPRGEPVADTMAGALPPLVESGVPLTVEEDRRRAVLTALAGLAAGDVLALCGKGHEDYQVMDGYTVFLDEHAIVRQWLAENGLLR